MSALPTLGGEWPFVTAINERGQVADWSTSSSSNDKRAFLWSAESGIVTLGSLVPGEEGHATATKTQKGLQPRRCFVAFPSRPSPRVAPSLTGEGE